MVLAVEVVAISCTWDLHITITTGVTMIMAIMQANRISSSMIMEAAEEQLDAEAMITEDAEAMMEEVEAAEATTTAAVDAVAMTTAAVAVEAMTTAEEAAVVETEEVEAAAEVVAAVVVDVEVEHPKPLSS